jgi:hypothetical protein
MGIILTDARSHRLKLSYQKTQTTHQIEFLARRTMQVHFNSHIISD